MRTLLIVALLAGGSAVAQQTPTEEPKLKSRSEAPPPDAQSGESLFVVRPGTKIPVALKHPVSTKGAQPGDPIYGETTFPIIAGGKVAIPAGTYVQGIV